MLIQSFSGIRGIYGKDLTEDIARRYTYVFNEFLRKRLNREPIIVVGYDTRASNNELKEAVFDYLFNIIDVGIMPVAAVELAVREYKADGGIMITASHNEPEFNGFKFLDNDGAILKADDADRVINEFNRISKLSEEEFLDRHLYKGELKNKIKRVDKKNKELIYGYSSFLKDIIGKIDNNHKIILDVNGGSGIILNEIIKILELKNIKIINGKAGEFKRKIEPNEESLKYLKDITKKEDAEFAAGFDCDVDRVEIILKDGNFVDGNYLLGLIVDYILSKRKGIVVVNDASSNLIRRVAEKYGCEVREVDVGEINVIDEMLKLKSPVGGEGSNGGVIIPPSKCRDGILSILLILKIINEKNKSLNTLISQMPKYYTIQKKVKFNKLIDNKKIKNKIKNYYLNKRYMIQETGGITGGLKIIINRNNFVWFRVSKTEPNLLRIIADSSSKRSCDRLLAEASSLL